MHLLRIDGKKEKGQGKTKIEIFCTCFRKEIDYHGILDGKIID